MPHYATSDDIVALYGLPQLILVSDVNKDRLPDDDVVEAGLQSADDLIDQFLSVQYTVPITPVPRGLKRIAIDIAVYTMAIGRSQRTEEMRVRYEDALAILKMMAAGKVGLGLPPVDTDGNGVPDSDPNRKRRGRFIEIGRG